MVTYCYISGYIVHWRQTVTLATILLYMSLVARCDLLLLHSTGDTYTQNSQFTSLSSSWQGGRQSEPASYWPPPLPPLHVLLVQLNKMVQYTATQSFPDFCVVLCAEVRWQLFEEQSGQDKSNQYRGCVHATVSPLTCD